MNRFYSWSIVTYGNKEEIERLKSIAKHYAFILHDKDGGEQHWHCIFTCEKWVSLNKIKDTINNGQNVLGEQMKDKEKAFRYLTHKDNPEKHQYEEKEIICDNIGYWKKEEIDTNNISQMIDDINNGISYREMAIRYGRDYIKNRHIYENFARIVMVQEMSKFADNAQEIDFDGVIK